MKPGETALLASTLVNDSRMKEYGDPTNTFIYAARVLEALTGVLLTPSTMCYAMVAVKLAREMHKHKSDNLVDACGYLSIINSLLENQDDSELNDPRR